MKRFPSPVRCILCSAVIALHPALSTLQASTLWSTDFTAPPYVLNETVIGKEGWVLQFSDSENADDATLVSYAGATGGTALEVISTSTLGSSQRRTRITNSFEKVTGPKVAVNLSMAFHWQGNSVNGTSLSFHENESASPVIISFTAQSGLTFSGTYGNLPSETILAAANMVQDQFYQFNFIFDFDQRVFSLNVNGERADGSDLNFSIENVGFRSNTPQATDGIAALRLINNRGDYIRYYVDGATIQAIPEATTSTLMGITLAALATGCYARKLKRQTP